MLNLIDRFRQRSRSGQGKCHSRFGGLWIDALDSMCEVDNRILAGLIQPELAERIRFFIENGYVIIPGAIAGADIDAYLEALGGELVGASPLKASVPVAGPHDKDVVPLQEADIDQPLVKLLDTYVHLPTARSLIFSRPIVQFLKAIFEESVLAFQSLHFNKGSTQAIHQDTAYVVLKEPMKLCAAWIALEDIAPGSGELMYYPGSHRLPDWIYSGRHKHFNVERDGQQQHLEHLDYLKSQSEKLGLRLQKFRPRKGDVLIWAADLAHGGSPIDNPSLTRKSLVAHYTNFSNTPHYFRYLKKNRREKFKDRDDCYFSTMYYC